MSFALAPAPPPPAACGAEGPGCAPGGRWRSCRLSFSETPTALLLSGAERRGNAGRSHAAPYPSLFFLSPFHTAAATATGAGRLRR